MEIVFTVAEVIPPLHHDVFSTEFKAGSVQHPPERRAIHWAAHDDRLPLLNMDADSGDKPRILHQHIFIHLVFLPKKRLGFAPNPPSKKNKFP